MEQIREQANDPSEFCIEFFDNQLGFTTEKEKFAHGTVAEYQNSNGFLIASFISNKNSIQILTLSFPVNRVLNPGIWVPVMVLPIMPHSHPTQ